MEFLIGFIFGVLALIAFFVITDIKTTNLDRSKINDIIEEAEKVGSIKYRFSIAEQLSHQQMDLLKQIYAPSKSASHSKWKNEIVQQVEIIEKEKIELFKSIVADGADPYLQFPGPDGELEKIRMSEAIKRSETNSDLPTGKHMPKTETISPREGTSNVFDLNAFREGKNNDKSSNPETPKS